MHVVVAEKAGYCFGIENAMKMVRELQTKNDGLPITTLGDISHNRQETERLQSEGIAKADSVDEVDSGYLVIRSHGVGKAEIEKARAKGLQVVNATCPFVRSMQKKIERYSGLGYQIVIVGDKNHPEVTGACGWCSSEPVVVGSLKEAEALGQYEKLCVVAQTTIIEKNFLEITEALKTKTRDIVIQNTICSATAERQKAAAKTARSVDGMIVVGGYHSSNTQKLAQLCKAYCKNTWHIETAGELNLAALDGCETVGITAGASTPDWIIQEVTESMEENKMAQEQVVDGIQAETAEAPKTEAPETAVEETAAPAVEAAKPADDVADEDFDFAAEIEEMPTIRKNSPITGTVLSVDDNEVILNIGYKADAVIPKRDYTWKDDEALTDLVKVGDTIEAIVTDMNDGDGRVKLSKIKFDNHKIQQKLAEAYENKTELQGKVKKVSGSGLIVDVGFAEIFMPASQYHIRYVKDLEALVGNDVRGIIIDYNAKRRRAILSQKVILEKELKERQKIQREAKEKRFGELNIDDVVTGRVKTITDFGIFVDLNGIDGFVHRSDLTWERNNEPKNLVEKGQEIQAKVISKNEEDKKIKLSVKALQERPWEQFIKNYKEGDEVEVRITNTLDFGAFAEIIPGVEGLIHVSEISYDRVESVSSVLSPGQTVTVKIIGINKDKEKISLSIKATLPEQERPQRQQRHSNNNNNRSERSYDNGGNGGYRRNSEGGNKGGGRNRKQQYNRNKTVYEENANVTLGDAFGSLFEGLDFDNNDDNKDNE
ncbi:MAG: bifunctional 4-hydroxy-3-methylbut-2-enyl diphosphate reductase/30S ribosomal protein S1 [Eubacteriaceae bacterium]|jgi:4-hydroxy-3-methylbut-2-enyl diphosphate reductase